LNAGVIGRMTNHSGSRRKWLDLKFKATAPRGAEPPRVDEGDSVETSGTGSLIINADDWGRDRVTTERTYDCIVRGTVSAVSAMVFMEDSERAANLALERGVDAGLHLNFSAKFTATGTPSSLAEHQRHLAAYLLRHPLARVVFHPGLARSFEYVVAVQIDEYHRLYGARPERLDGHHHLHLCSNVLLSKLLPSGTIVRRNFSFSPGEKSALNRFYRNIVDRLLVRRHRLVDFLFPLPPLQPPERVRRIFTLARTFTVELETHPVNVEEFGFLMGGQILDRLENVRIASGFGNALGHTFLHRGDSWSVASR
jgi:hypothetical protein